MLLRVKSLFGVRREVEEEEEEEEEVEMEEGEVEDGKKRIIKNLM